MTTTLQVKTRPPYEVLIGKGLHLQAGELLAQHTQPCRVMLVTDSTVDELYSGPTGQSLREAGFQVERHVIPAGEASKNPQELLRLWETLAQSEFSRGDWLVALGGGVTGDLAGFAAATYLRGIPFLQMPTTVMSAIDSSLGGKSAVNLSAGKNLAGVIQQPNLIICDTGTWQSLPEAVYQDGMAEAVKYGALADPELLQFLATSYQVIPPDDLVARCLAIKARFVATDERDQGRRQLLNLGHTVAHAIERLSDYQVSHGRAVAVGLAVISRTTAAHGMCSVELANQILRALLKQNLPIQTNYSAQALAQAALSDKKRRGTEIVLALPDERSEGQLHRVPIGQLADFLQSGLEGGR